MKLRLTIAALACALGTLAAAMPAEAGVNRRQAHQQHRITQGVNSGQLTARETNRLQKLLGWHVDFSNSPSSQCFP